MGAKILCMAMPQGDPLPRIPAFVLFWVLCCLLPAAAGAAEPRPAAGTLNPAELRALAEETRAAASIPGLAFGLIDGGEIVLAEGLGFADATTRRLTQAPDPPLSGGRPGDRAA